MVLTPFGPRRPLAKESHPSSKVFDLIADSLTKVGLDG